MDIDRVRDPARDGLRELLAGLRIKAVVRIIIPGNSRRPRFPWPEATEKDERKAVLAIPEGAVIYKKDRTAEVEIPDATSETGKRRIAVVTGISNGSKMQILKGLSENQQVILQ